jgi:tripartite-type tricarboxylate transporter receptor subunit TctC
MQQTGFVFGHVVLPSSGWNTLGDMWNAARARPGQLSYGTSGIATSNHLAQGGSVRARENAPMLHVPFRGTSENITALLGKQIDVIANSNAWQGAVESGQLKLLAVWTRDRLRAFPDVPTLLDLGYGMSVTSPYGIAGPKGMDPEIVEFLHQAFKRMQFSDQIQAYMARNDLPDEYLGPADYLAFARERAVYEERMVKRLNLSID